MSPTEYQDPYGPGGAWSYIQWSPAAVLSFDAGSTGTKHQVTEAKRLGIPTRVIPIH